MIEIVLSIFLLFVVVVVVLGYHHIRSTKKFIKNKIKQNLLTESFKKAKDEDARSN